MLHLLVKTYTFKLTEAIYTVAYSVGLHNCNYSVFSYGFADSNNMSLGLENRKAYVFHSAGSILHQEQ